MIKIDGVTKKYGSFTAVDNLNLDIKKGEIFGFLGPNGAGKTTTLKMMSGLLKINTGKITIGGHDITANPIEVKKIIGFIPDRPYIYEKLTGKEFLDFIAGIYHLEYDKKESKIKNLLQLFELDKWGDELIESYSLGMKQKIVMAGNILHDPDVYIVDEPMVGLDPKSAKIVKEIFIDLGKSGKTLFISTHSLEIVESLCDTIGIIMNGKIIAKGTIKEVKEMAKTEKSGLEDIFLSLTGSPDLTNVLEHIK
ncbi:MAG: ABC transporter [Candidatus Firestonebacteria bacterium RIFOXYC2_FULL_39_67]|nr:MAG: ABC transporter [Candidatus Firestonebacteria bacterium RIFOXYD2_FULL_39_29]OGF57066.1 MAG: ABC transporter [Candidatus Firestonebacteria bacterium RIFOXYC2_FULL_39_67]